MSSLMILLSVVLFCVCPSYICHIIECTLSTCVSSTVSIQKYTPIHSYTYTPTPIYTPTHTYTYTPTPTHTYTHTYTPTHTYTHTHLHTHLYTHTHLHTHGYTHIPVEESLFTSSHAL